MELLEVVSGLHHEVCEFPITLSQVVGSNPQGLVGFPDNGGFIGEFHVNRGAVALAQVTRHVHDFIIFVLGKVFPPEAPVFRRVGLAIGPLQTLRAGAS